ncbi:unnamed protein product [Bursaphelenchus xylophilus]|uniref:(pine wood nematode) hypothetical protein n=1 Tax=Bursaphelenchus xylophilus TaxID=6326 RepID=A0A1I7SR56_BURXY|nr:unnamed protein product [Bursaphelenchus xylophilus]CAG9110855.1 unnamed protein product [Bursaphelenchus xylophilus]
MLHFSNFDASRTNRGTPSLPPVMPPSLPPTTRAWPDSTAGLPRNGRDVSKLRSGQLRRSQSLSLSQRPLRARRESIGAYIEPVAPKFSTHQYVFF